MNIKDKAKIARKASILLGAAKTETKNAALAQIANALKNRTKEIIAANQKDLRLAVAGPPRAESRGTATPAPLLKRLKFDEKKIEDVCAGIESLIKLDDPVGKILSATELDAGLNLYKVSCPIGVIGVVFESRPDALVQISTLCLKSGNAVLLKGGSEAANTNKILTKVIADATQNAKRSAKPCGVSSYEGVPLRGAERSTKPLAKPCEVPSCGAESRFCETHDARRTTHDIPAGWIQLLETRQDVAEMLKQDDFIDLVIPRGSNEFVRYIMNHTNIPVLGHADGICHVYVDGAADIDMAVKISVDSKCQYVAVCNATETLLVDSKIAKEFLPKVKTALESCNVELRGCKKTRAIIKTKLATEKDWSTEYLDYILSIKVVDGLDEAIDHINKYGSHHTDAIVTQDKATAERFLDLVDSAGVFWNCSTRFADGYRYGLGAEVGISTTKIHARGPVGLEGLLIYKWKLLGSGQIVSDYSDGRKKFSHKTLNH